MVTSSPSLRFGPFILDQSTSSCGAGVSASLLAPRPLPSFGTWTAVPAGVAKEELLESAWPGVYVSGAALKVCIREIRKVLPTLGGSELVGREVELARIRAALARASAGDRQVLFITGKTEDRKDRTHRRLPRGGDQHR